MSTSKATHLCKFLYFKSVLNQFSIPKMSDIDSDSSWGDERVNKRLQEIIDEAVLDPSKLTRQKSCYNIKPQSSYFTMSFYETKKTNNSTRYNIPTSSNLTTPRSFFNRNKEKKLAFKPRSRFYKPKTPNHEPPRMTILDKKDPYRCLVEKCKSFKNFDKTIFIEATEPEKKEEPTPPRPNLIEELCKKAEFLHYHPPDPKKPLAIIDIEKVEPYFTSTFEKRNIKEIGRFLQGVYKYYNIVIWCALPMEDIIKMVKKYKLVGKHRYIDICFCLDINAVTVYETTDVEKTCLVKPLEIIWNFYDEFDMHNTILIDDNWQKFQYIPKYNAMKKVRAQKIRFHIDRRLVMMNRYLEMLATSGKSLSGYHPSLKILEEN